MTSRLTRARALFVLIAFTAAIVAGQGVASAALTVTGATLDGVTSTSTPPGGVMQAKVTASVTSGSSWRATRARIGGDAACANHGDHGSGTRTVSFNVTAPGTPGDYEAGFTAAGSNDCSAPQSPEKVLQHAVRVTTPGPNPNLPPRCGVNVMLVLDESGSISSSGATEQVRHAARAFLDALSGTGSSVSIIDFSTSAARPIGYTAVTPDSIASVFEPYLKHGYKPSGWTNWEAAFQKVREANSQGPVADLVVFITDGDPTARNNPPGAPVTGLVEGEAEALARASQQADLVKAQGSHVFALGVGAAVTTPASARRLTAISGFDRYPGVPFGEADYTLVKDFDALAEALRQIAIELCQASVTVTKLVDEGDGEYRPDPGWEFTASVATKPGGYTWTQPAPPPATGPRTETTNDDGVATFQWKPSSAGATSIVSLDEDQQSGYEFVDYTCEKSAPGKTRRRVIGGRSLDKRIQITIGPNEYAKCTIRNRIKPGTIEIEKEATPQGSRNFAFTGSLGPFLLVDDGTGTSSSRTFDGLAPGTYTVSEIVPIGWSLTGVTCSDDSVAIAGAQVTITLTPGASVVCTYRDLRDDEPAPPEPPTPPSPPTPPAPPPPPTPPPATQIRVEKTTPRVARVGDRLRFELTVTNMGSIPARNVRLADVPPASLSLELAGGVRPSRIIRGNAVWNLGTIPPGAKRTVGGVVAIKGGTPGIQRNLVVATAVNAEAALNRADTRVLPAKRFAPAVTG